MAFSTQEKMDEHAAGCRLTESAYEQQQRLGLQQKPAPLRVKRSRQSKGDSSDNHWTSDTDSTVTTTLVHHQSNNVTLSNHPNQPVPEPPAAHQQVQLPMGGGPVTGQQHSSHNAEYHPKPLVGTGRLASQQFTSGVKDLQQLQHQQQQDIIQQQSQFLQQLHAHQLYPQFYMQ